MAARLLALFLFLASTHSLFAQITFEPAPQSGQPFQIRIASFWRDSCVPVNPQVSIYGRELLVRFTLGSGFCLAAGSSWNAVIDVPPLGAGDWNLVFRLNDYDSPKVIYRSSFTVAGTPSGLRVEPNFDQYLGNRVVRISGPFGCTDCQVPRVYFGSVEAKSIEVVAPGVLEVAVPMMAGRRFHDVEVRADGKTWVEHSGFMYVGEGEYEAILLPSYTRAPVPGAAGSQWSTELRVVNTSATPMELGKDVFTLENVCAGEVCGDGPLLPNVVYRPKLVLPLTFSDDPPAGVVYVHRDFASHLAFSLRVRDVTRPAQSWGTEIPAVRSSRMKGTIDLLDVPMRSGYRQRLRLYGIASGGAADVSFRADDGSVIATRSIALRSPNGALGGLTPAPYVRLGSARFPLQPAYAEVDLATIPELAGKDTVRIRAFSYGQLWGFVTVTSSASNEVTTISPQ